MKAHLKSVAAPRSWQILKKEHKFTTRPKPGAHSLEFGVPLNSVIKLLGYAKTTREVKKILHSKEILVDGRRIKKKRFITGLMDSLQIGDDSYRVLVNKKGKLFFEKTGKDETKKKLCRIDRKYMHKNRVFLGLHDGRTLEGKKEFMTGDTLEISVPEQKILSHIRLENGAHAYMTGGKHIGETAVIEQVLPGKIVLKGSHGSFEAQKKSIFVTGAKKNE